MGGSEAADWLTDNGVWKLEAQAAGGLAGWGGCPLAVLCLCHLEENRALRDWVFLRPLNSLLPESFTFKDIKIFNFNSVCKNKCAWVTVLAESRGSHVAGVTGSCELPNGPVMLGTELASYVRAGCTLRDWALSSPTSWVYINLLRLLPSLPPGRKVSIQRMLLPNRDTFTKISFSIFTLVSPSL